MCNFTPAHLDKFLPQVSVIPTVNQVEVHPYYNQPALRALHDERGIVTQAWSPLAGCMSTPPAQEPKSALADPAISPIAAT